MRISDWSSDVCSSDLDLLDRRVLDRLARVVPAGGVGAAGVVGPGASTEPDDGGHHAGDRHQDAIAHQGGSRVVVRSEEHTSELQSLMRNSYAVLCLKKKTQTNTTD